MDGFFGHEKPTNRRMYCIWYHGKIFFKLSTTLLSGFISLFGSFLFLFLKELPEEEIREDKTTKDLAIEYFKSIDVVRDWRVQSIIPMACMFAIEQESRNYYIFLQNFSLVEYKFLNFYFCRVIFHFNLSHMYRSK